MTLPHRPVRRRVPPWLMILGSVLLGAWLLLLMLAIFSSPEPASAAGFLVFRNMYELTALALFVVAYFIVRRLEQTGGRRLSYLAVFASMALVLNPSVLHIVFRLTGLPWIGRGDSELRSFMAALIALTTGIVAAIRIRRSRGSLTGLPFALTGIIGGGIWVAAWIGLYLAFVHAMSGWR